MNEIEKQILKNQSTILASLGTLMSDTHFKKRTIKRMEETLELIYPKVSKEEGCEMDNKNGGDLCECGHKREEHKYDVSCDNQGLFCKLCDCKDFAKRGRE